MTDLMKNTLEAVQDILEMQYKAIETEPEKEQLRQQLDEKMEVIRGYLEGRWSLDV